MPGGSECISSKPWGHMFNKRIRIRSQFLYRPRCLKGVDDVHSNTSQFPREPFQIVLDSYDNYLENVPVNGKSTTCN